MAELTHPGATAASAVDRVLALARMPRWRFRPYNLVPFSVAFIASGNDNVTYLALGIAAIFLYSWAQDFSNISGDRVEDAINRPERVELARRAGGYAVVFRTSLVAAAAYVGVVAALVVWGGLDPVWVPLWLSPIVFTYAYSYGPHTKAGTYSSPLSHSLIPSFPLLVGWIGSGDPVEIVPYFVLLALIRLSNTGLGFKDIDDLAGDAAIGYRSIHTQIVGSRRPTMLALPILLSPYAALAAFGVADLIGEAWPIGFAMLPLGLAFLRIILAARTKTEGTAVREAGNFYMLTFIPLACFVLEPEWYTVAIGAGGLAWYTFFTLRWHLDTGELSREKVEAMLRLLRSGRSAEATR
jgi:4-hydroxybenzoate polyprenyltransferase